MLLAKTHLDLFVHGPLTSPHCTQPDSFPSPSSARLTPSLADPRPYIHSAHRFASDNASIHTPPSFLSHLPRCAKSTATTTLVAILSAIGSPAAVAPLRKPAGGGSRAPASMTLPGFLPASPNATSSSRLARYAARACTSNLRPIGKCASPRLKALTATRSIKA